MSLSKKDFKELAKIVVKVKIKYGGGVARYIEDLVVDFCKTQNPYFNRSIWDEYKSKIETQLIPKKEPQEEQITLKKRFGLKEEEEILQKNPEEVETFTGQGCSNCANYMEEKNWCKVAPYVFASAGGFLLYTWLGSPQKENKCPVFAKKSTSEKTI